MDRRNPFWDPTKKHCRFEGIPSTKQDWKDLYRGSTLTAIQDAIGASVTKGPHHPVPTPRRILVLFVPSKDHDLLITRFGITCYLEPLLPSSAESAFISDIVWRHDRKDALDIVSQALQRATIATDALKLEITDKGRSHFRCRPGIINFLTKILQFTKLTCSFAAGSISRGIERNPNNKEIFEEPTSRESPKGQSSRR